MPQPVPPLMRLAPADQPGAGLYNAYHFLSQLAGLYAQAEACEPDAKCKPAWAVLSESALVDVGELYLAWEATLQAAKIVPGAPIKISDLALSRQVATFCKRTYVYTLHLNTWTQMARWARITTRCERRWQRFVPALAAAVPEVAAIISPLAEGALTRIVRLSDLAERYAASERVITANFALAASLNSKSA